jgi:hypothetical protein
MWFEVRKEIVLKTILFDLNMRFDGDHETTVLTHFLLWKSAGDS